MRRIYTNILYSFSGEILLFGFSFILGILTARYLGPAGKGNYWVIYNGAGLLSIIFSMRFFRSFTYHLSKNKEMVGEILLYGLFVGLITVSCVAIAATLFSNILYNTLLKNITVNWAILSLLCLSYYLWTLIIAVIEGLMLFNAKTIFMGGSYLLKCFLVFLALGHLKLQFDELILLMGCVETIVYLLIIIILLGKAKHLNINVSSFKGMLKYSVGSFPGVVSDFILLQLSGFFINYFCGPAEVGIYAVAVSLASILLYLPTAMRNVLMPYIANFASMEITAKLSRLFIVGMTVLPLILIPLVWVTVIPIYGIEFSFSRNLFLILLPGSIFWGTFSLLAGDIEGRGFPWRISEVSMKSAVATFVLGLILIPAWNSTGGAIVTSVSHGITMILAIRLYHRMVGVNLTQLLIPKREDLNSLFKLLFTVLRK